MNIKKLNETLSKVLNETNKEILIRDLSNNDLIGYLLGDISIEGCLDYDGHANSIFSDESNFVFEVRAEDLELIAGKTQWLNLNVADVFNTNDSVYMIIGPDFKFLLCNNTGDILNASGKGIDKQEAKKLYNNTKLYSFITDQISSDATETMLQDLLK